MSVIDSILEHNKKFVEERGFEAYETTKFPDKKLVILTCMDTRLIELLPKAMNISNGDAKVVKNAGAILTDPFDSVMRSIIVALYELQADEVAVVGHYGCGMTGMNATPVVEKALDQGMEKSTLESLEYAGVDVEKWLKGFDDVEVSVKNSVDLIRRHPFLPKGTPVHGLVISPETGELTVVDKAE
ncbi:beta-class carbonic anhydrase [Thalassobacillus hwangdonensis]|uniref:carbonic anhydrase n=1 Tax=Thalassobacillus hwangdonensis TaxID=546108 RepID=A0ABW3L3J5_9BACI